MPTVDVMNVWMFWVPTVTEAAAVRSALSDQAVDAHVATRGQSCYLAVWSDRPDVAELVTSLSPRSLPVNLDHVPLPRRGESHLIS